MNLLARANTHGVGIVGLLVGGAAIIVPPVSAFFTLVSDPAYLVVLSHALEHAYLALRGHGMIPADEQFALAQLGGAFLAMIGGFVIALLCAYYGRPKTVPADTPSPSAPRAPEA